MTGYSKLLTFAAVIAVVFSIAVISDVSDAETTADGFEYSNSLIGDGYAITGYTGDSSVVIIPSTIGTGDSEKNVIEIANYAFRGSSIEEIVIPSTVENIGNSAFYGCSNLKFLTIEGSPMIGASAFMLCNSLELIDLKEAPLEIGSNAFMISTDGCLVRAPEGVNLNSTVDFEYTSTDNHIVRFESTTAPEGVVFPDFVILEPYQVLNLPDTVNAEGYDLELSIEGNVIESEYTAVSDVTITLTYTLKQINVTFSVDGVPFAVQVYDYGQTIIAPTEVPTKEPVDSVEYIFAEWEGFIEGMTATQDVTFNAVFNTVDHEYTIRFTVDGETYDEQKLTHGSIITAPAENPTKESTDGIDYVFSGWDGFAVGMTVTGDMTFEAQFDEVPQDSGSDDDTMLYIGIVVVIVIVILVAIFLLRKHF